jgi:glycosyltransferase involved in cell wall biosynthesis
MAKEGHRAEMTRLAVVASHPTQHFAPCHRELSNIDTVVSKTFYCCRWGVSDYLDPGFGKTLRWDVPLLDGYHHEFLPIGRQPKALSFLQVDNPRVGQALTSFRPDVVQLFGYAHRTNWRVARWCWQTRTPLLLTSDSHGGTSPALWKRIPKRLVVGYFYSFVDGATYVGDNNRTYHLTFGVPEDRLLPVPYPVDRTRLLASVPDRDEARRRIRQRHGIPADAFIVVFCGKLLRRKRPGDVVQAVRQLAGRGGAPAWALLVGDGPMRPELHHLLAKHRAENATLAGFVNQSSIGAYYAASDVLAVPSFTDPHPLVVTEASAFGLPTVVSDRVGCVGPNDTARPEGNAMVYACGDTTALANAIMRLRDYPAEYRRMSIEALRVSAEQDAEETARATARAAIALHRMGQRPRRSRGKRFVLLA